MSSGARSGCARSRAQRDSGTRSTCSIALTSGIPSESRLPKQRQREPNLMSTPLTSPGHGILGADMQAEREQLIQMLTKAYWMEIETVVSYIANSINPDGVRAQEIIESLKEDIQEELGHAQEFGKRIKELYGVVPGSLEFAAEQSYL